MTPEQHREAMLRGMELMGIRGLNNLVNVPNRTRAQMFWRGDGQWAAIFGKPETPQKSTKKAALLRNNRRKRKMSTKFVKFDNNLINLGIVNFIQIEKPSDCSKRWSVVLDTEDNDWSEWFDTEADAQARLDAIAAIITA